MSLRSYPLQSYTLKCYELYHGPKFDLNTYRYWTSSSSKNINKMQFNVGNDEIVEVDIMEDFNVIDEDPAV